MENNVSTTNSSSQPAIELQRAEREQRQGFARVFSSLRHRNYRLFWSGQLVSLIGTWMQTVAQGWLVLQLTDSAFLLGLVGALQFLPVFFFSLFGGVIADRFPKRNLLVVTQTVAMIQAFALAVLTSTGLVQIWHVMVLALLLGLVNAFDMPIRQSFIVEMVGKEDLMNGIALNSSMFNAARIIGPAVAGLLIAWLGLSMCFYLNAASFIAVIAGLLAMRIQPLKQHRSARDSVWKNISEGLQYARRTRIIWLIVMQVSLLAIFGMNFNVVIPLLARDVLNSGAEGYGLLMSAIGVGSLLGALSMAIFSRTPRFKILLLAGFFLGAFEVAAGYILWFPVTALLLVGVGFAFIVFAASANTLLQTTAPDHLRGRVMSVYTMFFAGASPVGSLLAGAMAHSIGPVAPFIYGGLICALSVVVGWRLFTPRQDVA